MAVAFGLNYSTCTFFLARPFQLSLHLPLSHIFSISLNYSHLKASFLAQMSSLVVVVVVAFVLSDSATFSIYIEKIFDFT